MLVLIRKVLLYLENKKENNKNCQKHADSSKSKMQNKNNKSNKSEHEMNIKTIRTVFVLLPSVKTKSER